MTREQAERLYGPIKIWLTGAYTANDTFEASFDKHYDLGMPSWMRAFGKTEGEALATLLEQAEDHALEGEPTLAKGISDLCTVIDRILGIDRIEQQAEQIVLTEAQKERRSTDELYQNELQRRSGC